MISVEQAIEDLKNGKMLVMVDDVDRENEGDLVFASTFSSAQKVNFAITHARGVLCVALSPQIAQQLDLNLMVDKNTSSHETAFTVTIDAKDAKTGVSAYERNMTIELMSRVGARADDFVRPGHIFPLIAKSGGVLVYSTCTIEREENEAVVEDFLARHEEFSLENAGELLPLKKRPERMLQLYPQRDGTDGFFIARMRRR